MDKDSMFHCDEYLGKQRRGKFYMLLCGMLYVAEKRLEKVGIRESAFGRHAVH
jgi:hypothetical protein